MKPCVLLLSTVHPANDPRIIYKIVPALAGCYQLVVALPGVSGRPVQDAIGICLPRFRKLWLRLLISHPVALFRCLYYRPRIIHIFSPELIPIAFIFYWLGAAVIYEVQENFYLKIPVKKYNNAWIFRAFFRWFDHLARRYFHFVFTDDSYLENYPGLKYRPAIVHNYACLRLSSSGAPVSDEAIPFFLYSGVISNERAFDTLCGALHLLDTTGPAFGIHFFGTFTRGLQPEVRRLQASLQRIKVRFHGYRALPEVLATGRHCIGGIALLKPVGDYPRSFPGKLFDYMSLGLPVITSDFPLYRAVVETNRCGFCVSPYDRLEVARKIRRLLGRREEARAMGLRGRNAVHTQYNWQQEATILKQLYGAVKNMQKTI